MEPINVVTLVGLIGSAIGYLFSRLDQRSARARLKHDMKLLEMAPAGSAARGFLEALVDREAERLNRPWTLTGYRLLSRGLWILAAGAMLYIVAYGVHYSAFHYFDNSLTEYVSYGDGGGYQLNNAGNWVVGTTYSLQTLGAAVVLLGIGTILISLIAQLARRIQPELISRSDPGAPAPQDDLEVLGQK